MEMGYRLSKAEAAAWFGALRERYTVWAPVLFPRTGCYADTDVIRYAKVDSLEQIEFSKRSDYSFKETLLPIRETLFYFAEGQAIEPRRPEKPALIFLRACEIHALKRLDAIYLHNGPADAYFARRREGVALALIDCPTACDTGFCRSMGTDRTDDWDMYLSPEGDGFRADVRGDLPMPEGTPCDLAPRFVSENNETVRVPETLPKDIAGDPIWKEYDSRCVGCGRCNFVCPTCTCFTTQDVRTADNTSLCERSRVWASCQVDGYTDIAGGGSFRKTRADRMRFKVLHKIVDFKERFGYTMCVGCGRCDAVCPEYISYAALLNRLSGRDA